MTDVAKDDYVDPLAEPPVEADPRVIETMRAALTMMEGLGWDSFPVIWLLDADYQPREMIAMPGCGHPCEGLEIAFAQMPEEFHNAQAILFALEGYTMDPWTGQRTGDEERMIHVADRDRPMLAVSEQRSDGKQRWLYATGKGSLSGRVPETMNAALHA